MKISIKHCIVTIASVLCTMIVLAQNVTAITGSITNKATKENLAAVSVTVKGTSSGTYTDERGKYRLTVNQQPPFTLIISSVGYTDKEVQVTDASQALVIEMDPSYALGEEIVVAASRVPERILQSPVSIERVNSLAIINAPAPSYYDLLNNLKGVDFTTSSLTFKTPSTRGFNGSGNVRFNQIVNGMDNQAPGLNFSLGSVIGLTQLDVDNMELLEGASSALYGPGGMNGTLIVSSKDPFKYQGVSAEIKQGVMNINSPARNASPYYDLSLRWAEKLSDKFAFKLSAQYIEAKDWVAYDSSDYNVLTGQQIPGTRFSDPNYNGVNLYGDETTQNLSNVDSSILRLIQGAVGSATYNALYGASQQFFAANPNATQSDYNAFLNSIGGGPLTQPLNGLVPSTFLFGSFRNFYTGQNVSRTGYKEQDVVEPTTRNIRLSAALDYKISDRLTLTLSGNYGTGNTVYTGSDRYVLKNLQMGQYKIELKSNDWFLRAYTTQENSGDAYNATVNTRLLNEAWGGGSNVWYPTYMTAFTAYRDAGLSPIEAANAARIQADQGRPAPGSAQFNHLADSIARLPIPQGGHFLDKTNLYFAEAQYDLTNALGLDKKGTDVLIGGDIKEYVLNSQGTLFADKPDSTIKINEFGIYAQVSQNLFHDVLKLSLSSRYDKNENFEGRFTPRASAVITVAKNQNIRLSYQQAYRFPTTQNQWINLNTGAGILIGGLPQLRDLYGLNPYDKNYNPGFTQTSVVAGNPQIATFGKYTPETANSFEAGFKGLEADNKLLIDVYGYFAEYKNLITRITVLQLPEFPDANAAHDFATGNYQGISVSVNSPIKVNTSGFGASLQYLLRHNFYITANFSSDNINKRNEVYSPTATFKSYYNTPKYRSNLGFGNSGFGNQSRIGFNIMWHWQDNFYVQSDFINGYVNAYSSLDAQVSYKFPSIKSMIKLGTTNLTNHYYINAPGNPSIGGLYYISLGYNVF